MKIPFVSFIPLEKELDKELRDAFERVYTRSWYIEGEEDKAFEKAFDANVETTIKQAKTSDVVSLTISDSRPSIAELNML